MQEIADLVCFVGLVARLHHYVNRKENSAFFPGAKTVIATGYRRTFLVRGTEDVLAANFAFSNAYLAEKALHGPKLFLDDYIVELLSLNPFAMNLLRFASYIQSSGSFDLFRGNDDIEGTKTEPFAITLFRKPFSFREFKASIVTYLQLIPRLSSYLMGEKDPKGKGVFQNLFKAIRNGLSAKEMSGAIAPGPPVVFLRNDMEDDIRILAELMESGCSVISEERRARQLRDDMVRANPS